MTGRFQPQRTKSSNPSPRTRVPCPIDSGTKAIGEAQQVRLSPFPPNAPLDCVSSPLWALRTGAYCQTSSLGHGTFPSFIRPLRTDERLHASGTNPSRGNPQPLACSGKVVLPQIVSAAPTRASVRVDHPGRGSAVRAARARPHQGPGRLSMRQISTPWQRNVPTQRNPWRE